MSGDPIAHLLDVCQRVAKASESSYDTDYVLPDLIVEMRTAMDAAGAAYKAAPEAIVAAVLADITDRRGFSQAWDAVPRDIRKQIRKALRVAVVDALRGKEDT